MWEKITNIAKTAASMIQGGKFPPNTPPQHQEDMSKINFLASKKFFIVFISLLMLLIYFGASVVVLFLTAPFPTLTVPFVTMYVEAIKVLSLIVATFLGIQTIADFSFRSSSSTDLRGENTNQVIESNSTNKEEITQNITETIDDSRSRPDYEEE